MSGSFVVAGTGAYRATKVGPQAYAASWPRRPASSPWCNPNCAAGINRILQFITYLLVPAGLLIDLHAVVHHARRLAAVGAADGGRAGADGARRPGADDLGRIRGRRRPARSTPVPGAGAARDRGIWLGSTWSAPTRPAPSPKAGCGSRTSSSSTRGRL